MTTVTALDQFGTTRRQLLQELLGEPHGVSVQVLCTALGISHNAVRQHLNALMSEGFVVAGREQPTGGRPEARYVLTDTGRSLFPRHYDWIAIGLLEEIHARYGASVAADMLESMGRRFGAHALEAHSFASPTDRLKALAERMDALGYATDLVTHGDEMQIEARNCPFEAICRRFPEVCRFDQAFLEAASGQTVTIAQCAAHGAATCRFGFSHSPA